MQDEKQRNPVKSPFSDAMPSIAWPWRQDSPTLARPHWRHWLIAALILFVLGMIVPIVAAFA